MAKLVLHISNYISNQNHGPAYEYKFTYFGFQGNHSDLQKVVPDLREISYLFLHGMPESVINYNFSELYFPVKSSRSYMCAFHCTEEEVKQPALRNGKGCFA